MPHDEQEAMLKTIPGLEHAVIAKYAYAIEYDAIDPRQLYPSLSSKKYPSLYFAGQVNGTSGYEEAACQGLMAGINASRSIDEVDPIILKRTEAYIGVLIDDLVTKGVKDPYRLLTSRAEYRLLLRHDNADVRLKEIGYEVGLIDNIRYNSFKAKMKNVNTLKETLQEIYINPTTENNNYLNSIGTVNIKEKISIYGLFLSNGTKFVILSSSFGTTSFSNDFEIFRFLFKMKVIQISPNLTIF